METMDYIKKIAVIDGKSPWSIIGAAYDKYQSRDWMETINVLNGIEGIFNFCFYLELLILPCNLL